MQGGSSDCGLFAVAFATVLCCGFNPAHVQYIFPEPSYAMPTEQVYDNISIMQKKVICNSSHKARNNHNSRHLQTNISWTIESFSVVFARFGITKNMSAFQGTYGKIAV